MNILFGFIGQVRRRGDEARDLKEVGEGEEEVRKEIFSSIFKILKIVMFSPEMNLTGLKSRMRVTIGSCGP
jgi:hypothetical protein